MSNVDEFLLKSAISYLQSVVYVDDKIYYGSNPVEESAADLIGEKIALPPSFTATEASAEENATQALPPQQKVSPAIENGEPNPNTVERQQKYHPRELMESFAKQGVICALYQPQEGFDTEKGSELFKLCERADVTILDWDLFNDKGAGVSKVLSALIQESDATAPHHIRLCAIYTDTPNLYQVMSDLFKRLNADGCDVQVEEGKLQLVAGATRVCIFGKPSSSGRDSESKKYEVAERDLADQVVREFANLHRGLLPAFALHGLAAVRRNTKRFLDKFRAEMDGAFFLHRALALDSTDAFDQLPELLADEIRAVLEDEWPGEINLSELASSGVNLLAIKESDPRWTKEGRAIESTPILKAILTDGPKALAQHHGSCIEIDKFDKKFRGAPAKRLLNFADLLSKENGSWSDRLAALFCSRTQYNPEARTLRFGTIVRHRESETANWEFSVCLMPICDSQRLKKNVLCVFPFWRLKEDARCGKDGKRSGVVAIDPEGGTHCLAAGGKIRDNLWLERFIPGEQQEVIAQKSASGFLFAAEGKSVEWIAELKPLHAQRIASYLGQEVSRVGLVESEWLRLLCDR